MSGQDPPSMPSWDAQTEAESDLYPDISARHIELMLTGRQRLDVALMAQFTKHMQIGATRSSGQKKPVEQHSSRAAATSEATSATGKKTPFAKPSFAPFTPAKPAPAENTAGAVTHPAQPTQPAQKKPLGLPADSLISRGQKSQEPPEEKSTPEQRYRPLSQAPATISQASGIRQQGLKSLLSPKTSAQPVTNQPARTSAAPPGTYKKVRPPSSGFIDYALSTDGWTRWQSYAGYPKSIPIKHVGGERHGQPLKDSEGKDAVATKLDPKVYGGNQNYDIGWCEAHIMHGKCPADWGQCEFRHWGPEPIEWRWMDEKFISKLTKRFQGPLLPPDNAHSRYTGRPRQYHTGALF